MPEPVFSSGATDRAERAVVLGHPSPRERVAPRRYRPVSGSPSIRKIVLH